MKKTVVVIAMLLSACANQQDLAYKAKNEMLSQAAKEDSAALAAGTMKQSEYYSRLYERLSQPPVSPPQYAAMQGASRMIDVAKDYEAGRITKDQFDSAHRQAMIEFQGTMQRAQAQAAAQADANRRAAAMYMLQNRPITTNCNRFGNSSTCTTY